MSMTGDRSGTYPGTCTSSIIESDTILDARYCCEIVLTFRSYRGLLLRCTIMLPRYTMQSTLLAGGATSPSPVLTPVDGRVIIAFIPRRGTILLLRQALHDGPLSQEILDLMREALHVFPQQGILLISMSSSPRIYERPPPPISGATLPQTGDRGSDRAKFGLLAYRRDVCLHFCGHPSGSHGVPRVLPSRGIGCLHCPQGAPLAEGWLRPQEVVGVLFLMVTTARVAIIVLPRRWSIAVRFLVAHELQGSELYPGQLQHPGFVRGQTSLPTPALDVLVVS